MSSPAQAAASIHALLHDLHSLGVTDVVGETPYPWRQAPAPRPTMPEVTEPAQPTSQPAPTAEPKPMPLAQAAPATPPPAIHTWVMGAQQPRLVLVATTSNPAHQDQLPFEPDELKLMQNMLQAIGVDWADVSIHAAYLPMGMAKAALLACKAFTDIAGPCLALGKAGISLCLQQERSVDDARAQNLSIGVTYHPRTLLKQPLLKRQAWQDLLKFQASMGVK